MVLGKNQKPKVKVSFKKSLQEFFVKIVKRLVILLLLLLFAGFSYGEDDFDYEKQISQYEDKMRERTLEPIEANLLLTKRESQAWEGFKSRLNIFNDKAKELYDPTKSPFNKMLSKSSKPSSFEATTKPSSLAVGEHEIHVLEIAKKDVIASKKIKRGARISGGMFMIKGGNNEEVRIDFKGGTLEDLDKLLSKSPNKLYKSSITKLSDEYEILLLEGENTGVKNALVLEGQRSFLEELGFFKKEKDINGKDYLNLINLQKERLGGSYSVLGERGIRLNEESKLLLSFLPIRYKESLVMKGEVRVLVKEKEKEKEKKKEGKEEEGTGEGLEEKEAVGAIDSVRVGHIRLYTKPLIQKFEDETKKLERGAKTSLTKEGEKAGADEVSIKFVGKDADAILAKHVIKGFKGGSKGLITGSKSKEGYKEVLIDVEKSRLKNDGLKYVRGEYIQGLVLENGYKDRRFEIRNIRIYDPYENKRRGEYNFIEQAQDAKILFNGVLITRDRNNIEDLLKGVVLEIKSVTKDGGKLRLYRDYDVTVEQIEKFVDEYNNVMLYIRNVTTYVPRRTLEELLKEEEEHKIKSYEEREYAKLSGEYYKGVIEDRQLIRSIRGRIRGIMVSTPYGRLSRNKIKFLSQIGVSNTQLGVNAVVDTDSLKRAYLYVRKAELKSSLQENFKEVKELFAHATEGSTLRDRGIAVEIVKVLESYIKRTMRGADGRTYLGPIEVRLRNLEEKSKRLESRKEAENKRVEKKLKEFRVKIEKLKGIRKRSKDTRKRFDGIFKSFGR